MLELLSNLKDKFSKLIQGKVIAPGQVSATLHEGAVPKYIPNPRNVVDWGNHGSDFKFNVSDSDWYHLLKHARDAWANNGSLSNAINDLSDLATNDSWYAQYDGDSSDWGDEAEEAIGAWQEICDIRGISYPLQTLFKLVIISVIRDGDCLCVFTSAADGKYPKLQFIPAHRIGSRGKGVIESGLFTGYTVAYGLIYNDSGAIIGFNILGNAADGSQDIQVSSTDAHYCFMPQWIDSGVRGYSALSPALGDLASYGEIKRMETLGLKARANIALVKSLPEGSPELQTPAGYTDSPDCQTTTNPPTAAKFTKSIEKLQGGEVPVFEASSGAKIEFIQGPNRPDQNAEKFMTDHILRNGFATIGLPLEYAFSIDSGGSTTRLILAKVQRRVEAIQSQVLYPLWKRINGFAISRFIKYGYVSTPPSDKDWRSFSPTYPKSISIDAFKDTKSDDLSVQKCWTTNTQVAASYGYSFKKNVKQKSKELQFVAQVAAKDGVDKNELLQLASQVVEQKSSTSNNSTDKGE